jgi:1-acyl-sn-glycerol-3-phosphate acyltransferase
MINILTLLAILGIFIRYDLSLRLGILIDPKRSIEIAARSGQQVVARLLALVKVWNGFRLQFDNVSGAPLPPRFILVSNHQSLIDIPILIGLMSGHRLRFIAKRELGAGIPLVSLLLRTEGHALIKRRGDSARTMRAITRFSRRCMRDGGCPVVFPEGTRSRDGSVGTFYTAGFRRALEEERLPIVVAAIEGGWRISGLNGAVKNLTGIRYFVRVLRILPAPSGKKEALDAIAGARETIVLAIDELRRRI